MGHRHCPSGDHFVILFDGVVNLYLDPGKGAADAPPKCFELIRTMYIRAKLRLAVPDRIFGAHLVNGLAAAPVPHFFEPPTNQICILSHCKLLTTILPGGASAELSNRTDLSAQVGRVNPIGLQARLILVDNPNETLLSLTLSELRIENIVDGQAAILPIDMKTFKAFLT